MTVVVCTGGFDPIHSGHIKYLNDAKQLGNVLVVGLNSDAWLTAKKKKPFLTFDERKSILTNLRMVDSVIAFDDSDGTATDAIQQVKKLYPGQNIVFANGGDRTLENIPELNNFKDDNRVSFALAVGGDHKLNSSSWILDNWCAPKVMRVWGFYQVLREDDGYKVKYLEVEPGKQLSMQRHEKRHEHWLVSQGAATVEIQSLYSDEIYKTVLNKHNTVTIPAKTWHRLSNNTNDILSIIEIQYGEQCAEDDIERKL